MLDLFSFLPVAMSTKVYESKGWNYRNTKLRFLCVHFNYLKIEKVNCRFHNFKSEPGGAFKQLVYKIKIKNEKVYCLQDIWNAMM